MASLENELAYEREVRELREEIARLQSDIDQWHQQVRLAGMELQDARAKMVDAMTEVARLEGLILNASMAGLTEGSVLEPEADRIRAQREEE